MNIVTNATLGVRTWSSPFSPHPALGAGFHKEENEQNAKYNERERERNTELNPQVLHSLIEVP
jgi:hypothetical protein